MPAVKRTYGLEVGRETSQATGRVDVPALALLIHRRVVQPEGQGQTGDRRKVELHVRPRTDEAAHPQARTEPGDGVHLGHDVVPDAGLVALEGVVVELHPRGERVDVPTQPHPARVARLELGGEALLGAHVQADLEPVHRLVVGADVAFRPDVGDQKEGLQAPAALEVADERSVHDGHRAISLLVELHLPLHEPGGLRGDGVDGNDLCLGGKRSEEREHGHGDEHSHERTHEHLLVELSTVREKHFKPGT